MIVGYNNLYVPKFKIIILNNFIKSVYAYNSNYLYYLIFFPIFLHTLPLSYRNAIYSFIEMQLVCVYYFVYVFFI